MVKKQWWSLCLMVVLLGLMGLGMTAPTLAATQDINFMVSASGPDAHNAVALARLAVIGDDSFMRGASIALVLATLGIVIALRRR